LRILCASVIIVLQIKKQTGKTMLKNKFAFTVINYNTLLIVNSNTQQQRYAHNVTLPSLYAVTQAQLAKLFKTATAN
jgi:hypothetical protein